MELTSARAWSRIVKGAYEEWSNDNCLQIGAALSFYTVTSMVPLLLVLTSLATYLALFTGYGQDFTASVLEYIRSNVGPESSDALKDALEQRKNSMHSGSIIGAVVGFITLLFTATSVFGQLDAAFDDIWDVPQERRPSGVVGTIKAKLFSFGMLLGLAFVLLVSTLLTAALSRVLGAVDAGPGWLLAVANFVLQLGLVSVVFMLLFKYLPSVPVAWAEVLPGGVVTAVLWLLGQHLLSLYLARAGFSSYGVAGGLLAFLVYVYYSSQILFFGGELCQVYARTRRGEGARREDRAPGAEGEKTRPVERARAGRRPRGPRGAPAV